MRVFLFLREGAKEEEKIYKPASIAIYLKPVESFKNLLRLVMVVWLIPMTF